MGASAIMVMDRQAEAARAPRQGAADPAHADDAEPLAVRRLPSIETGAQPRHSPERIRRSPSTSRREAARISAIAMSAVSSVNTPGVFVTVMPLARAAPISIWSVPVPNEAISCSCAPAAPISSASIRSVTVGTRMSALPSAARKASRAIGSSVSLSRVSNSSIIRVSITSGSFRVTTTSGRLRAIGS